MAADVSGVRKGQRSVTGRLCKEYGWFVESRKKNLPNSADSARYIFLMILQGQEE